MNQVELEHTDAADGSERLSRRTWVFGGALTVLFALLTLWTLGLRQAGGGPEIGQPAPDFTLELYEGGELRLSDLRGQVVLLNFWASWCDPCRDEAPALERVWRDYKDKGVVFIGIDYVDLESSAQDYLAEFDVTYPNGLDTGQRISRAYRIRGVPETFFVDKQGNIAPIFVNGAPQPKKISPITEAELRTGLERLLSAGAGEESG
jgi:cytochrome c biogenesis protein CcmG/thiol:disulfide interchange protein DsbE